MVEIRYFSKSGNTKAIAQSIAAAVGAEAHDISTPLSGKADILFLGGAVYAFRIAGKLKKFIKTLSPEAVGKVVVFSTAGNPAGASQLIKKQLRKCGIVPAAEEFHCVGRLAEDEAVQKQAAQFARETIDRLDHNKR